MRYSVASKVQQGSAAAIRCCLLPWPLQGCVAKSGKMSAVSVASDTMALGALRALREAELDVTDDIGVLGFDGQPHVSTADLPLSTLWQPIRRLGDMAVETLCDLLDNGREPPRRIIMPTELGVRASCGSLR